MARRREEIEAVLADEIEIARVQFEAAKKRFNDTISELPSGLPAPDGSLRINQLGLEHRAALDALRAALSQFNDFIIHGIIPEDLK